MSHEIEQRKTAPPSEVEWAGLKTVADTIANTEFVKKGLRGKPEAVMACILSGRELGLGPMQSLQHIDMVDGKPTPSAELQRSLVLKEGHIVKATEATAERATVWGKRSDTGIEDSVTWTLEDADRAGLRNKNNWKGYPRAMLVARASSELCSRLFPDVLAGLARYLADELGEEEPETDLLQGTPEPIQAEVIPDEDNGSSPRADAAHIEGADAEAAQAAPSDSEEGPSSMSVSEVAPPPSDDDGSASSPGGEDVPVHPGNSSPPGPSSEEGTAETLQEAVEETEEQRKKVLASIFAKAGEAGMSEDRVKAQAYARYGVSSMTQIPIEGLRDFYRDIARMAKNHQEQQETEEATS